MNWNPRFAAYATSHGKTPEEMLRYDEEFYPGGRMAGFVIWISGKWMEYCRQTGARRDFLTQENHEKFDKMIGAI